MALTVLWSIASSSSPCGPRALEGRVGPFGVEQCRRELLAAFGQRGGERLDHRLWNLRGHVNGQPAFVEHRQEPPKPRHRAAAHRQRAVPAGTPDRHAGPADGLLGDLNRVRPQAGDNGQRGAELAERVLDAIEQLRVLLDEEPCSKGRGSPRRRALQQYVTDRDGSPDCARASVAPSIIPQRRPSCRARRGPRSRRR